MKFALNIVSIIKKLEFMRIDRASNHCYGIYNGKVLYLKISVLLIRLCRDERIVNTSFQHSYIIDVKVVECNYCKHIKRPTRSLERSSIVDTRETLGEIDVDEGETLEKVDVDEGETFGKVDVDEGETLGKTDVDEGVTL